MANSMLSKTIVGFFLLCAFASLADTSVVVQSPWTAPFEYQYRTVATLKSRYVIKYAAQTEGQVADILASGDVVSINNLLVRQSDPLKQLALERAESVVSSLAASRDLAQLQVNNLDALVRSNSVSNQQAKAHRLTLAKAQADLEAQQSQAKELHQSLAFLSTRAVRPGVVVEQHANIGEFVEKGDALLTTVDMSAVQYWVALPLAQAAQVNEHTRVATLSGDISLQVVAVVPSGKTSVSVITSVFDMSGLTIGHMATQPVVVTLHDDKPLQWFHRDGVIDGNGISQVKVIDIQGHVATRTVVIAAEKGEFVGVAGQFHRDDQIILRGMDGLSENSQVHIDGDLTIELQKQFAAVGVVSSEKQAW